MTDGAALSVSRLHKKYGDFEAVRGIDFEVAQGEVFGLLGPNGAGKTTTVEILEGLRSRTSGDVTVLGHDPEDEPRAVKDRIGVSLQATNLPDKIRVIEACQLFSAFYTRRTNIETLLKRLQLWDKRRAYYTTLSGGQKQRLALALAMVNEPAILFLDEPTTGLDPQVRLEIHTLIEELRDAKTTILLTTHYIEEAERLCDRVAIIDEGRIIALGTPRELQEKVLGHARVEIVCHSPLHGTPPHWSDEAVVQISENGLEISVASPKPARAVVELVKWIDGQGVELADIHIKRPTLEDVFIQLTGKSLRE
ncbi:MAG: ABC transporter ATP-binding protein [Bryobacterales bacterium]|nr:ABC transporter ATP-binding protein [Bryobacterales bacterium]